MIEATLSLVETASPKPPPVSRRWLFYTALRFPSSTSAPGVRALPPLKSFGRDSAHNAGNWRAMGDGCGSKGMASTAVRFAVSVWDGL